MDEKRNQFNVMNSVYLFKNLGKLKILKKKIGHLRLNTKLTSSNEPFAGEFGIK